MVRKRTGRVHPLIDVRNLPLDPRAVLGRMCSAIGVPFQERMLSWPPGRGPTGGV